MTTYIKLLLQTFTTYLPMINDAPQPGGVPRTFTGSAWELEAERQMDRSEFKASLSYYTRRATVSIYIVIRSHKQTGSPNQPPSNHLGANLKNLRASFRCQWCHKRSAFLVLILAQVSGLPLPWTSQLPNAVKKTSDTADIAESCHSGASPANNRLLLLLTADRARRGRERRGRTWPGAFRQLSPGSRVRGPHRPGANDRPGTTLQTLLPAEYAGCTASELHAA